MKSVFIISLAFFMMSIPDVSAEGKRGHLVSDKFFASKNGYYPNLVQGDWPMHIRPETEEVIYEPSESAFDSAVKKAIESRLCKVSVAVKKTLVTSWSPSRPPSRWVRIYLVSPCDVAATI